VFCNLFIKIKKYYDFWGIDSRKMVQNYLTLQLGKTEVKVPVNKDIEVFGLLS
jgi:hypothetical protein